MNAASIFCINTPILIKANPIAYTEIPGCESRCTYCMDHRIIIGYSLYRTWQVPYALATSRLAFIISVASPIHIVVNLTLRDAVINVSCCNTVIIQTYLSLNHSIYSGGNKRTAFGAAVIDSWYHLQKPLSLHYWQYRTPCPALLRFCLLCYCFCYY